jgi:hypothetical protein
VSRCFLIDFRLRLRVACWRNLDHAEIAGLKIPPDEKRFNRAGRIFCRNRNQAKESSLSTLTGIPAYD